MLARNWDSIAKQLGFDSETLMWKAYYEVQGRSISELARRFGIGSASVHARLAACGIPSRPRGGVQFQRVVMTEEIAKRCKDEGTASVANDLGIPYNTLYKALKRFEQPEEATPPPSEGPSSV